jgi:hypothetical protein
VGIVSEETRWLASRTEDGEIALRIGRRGPRLVAEWPTIGTLSALVDGSDAQFVPAPDADARDVEKVRVGAAHALVERLRGKLALHASAVAIGARTCLLVGRSEAGKSTMAAHLCARGASLVADDIAIVQLGDDRVVVEPTEHHHWLSSDVCESMGIRCSPDDEKTAVEAPRRPSQPMDLSAIVVLEFADGAARIAPLTGLAVMNALVRSVVRFVVDDEAAIAHEARDLISIAGRVPFFVLERPRDLHRLEESADILRAILEERA